MSGATSELIAPIGVDNIELDFSELFTQATESPIQPLLEVSRDNSALDSKNRLQGKIDGIEREQAKLLYLSHKSKNEERERSLEVYRTYQENIKKSSQLQTEILKGIRSGEDIATLFLKASKAISLMTGNTVFYSQVEADIVAIYGEGLLQPAILEKELSEVEERLSHLQEALKRELEPDSRSRIEKAIEKHKEKIGNIKQALA